MGDESFETALDAVVRARVAGCEGLRSVERLSGGASQETYRLIIATDDGGARPLAMRRAPGGVKGDHPTAPGLAVEALLMRVARANGVPEPEVFHVLDPEDGLGEGFIMEWLDGEALGARIVRAAELDAIRPQLAFQCGQALARIHAIDLDATGLRTKLSTVPTDEFVQLMCERYHEYATPQPMIDYSARWLAEHLPADVPHALVHNDFRNGNIMFGPDGIVAVLD